MNITEDIEILQELMDKLGTESKRAQAFQNILHELDYRNDLIRILEDDVQTARDAYNTLVNHKGVVYLTACAP